MFEVFINKKHVRDERKTIHSGKHTLNPVFLFLSRVSGGKVDENAVQSIINKD